MKNFSFKKIDYSKKPFVIAEVGVNHENNINLAEKIIKQAKIGGADAVKFQTYKANLLASQNSPYYWDLKKVAIKSQYKLFQKFDKFDYEDYIKLKKICDHYKIIFSSTPFDINSAIFLNKIVSFFKVASADITNFPLLDTIFKFKKPVIISTGASVLSEIKNIKKRIDKKFANSELIFLHCVLSYPTKYNDANLNMIKFLKKQFPKNIIGYSDHTLPDEEMLVLREAYNIGANIIEKHFTLDKLKGKKNNDHFHSMDFNDLQKFFKLVEKANMVKGDEIGRPLLKCEQKSRKNARRSLYTFGKIFKNEKFSNLNVIAKRPGGGICPSKMHQVIGKKAKKNLKDDHKITKQDFFS